MPLNHTRQSALHGNSGDPAAAKQREAVERLHSLDSESLWRRGLQTVCGVVAALLVPVVVVSLGLLAQLLIERNGGGPPSDGLLAVVTARWIGTALEQPTVRGLVLLAVAAGGAMLWVVLRGLLEWTFQARATRLAVAVRSELRGQAIRLGDRLARVADRQQALPVVFQSRTVDWLDGRLVRWRTLPQALLAVGLLFLLAMSIHFWIALLAILLAVVTWYRGRLLLAAAQQRDRALANECDLQAEPIADDLALAPVAATFGLAEPPGSHFATAVKSLASTEQRRRESAAHVPLSLAAMAILAVGLVLLVAGLNQSLSAASAFTMLLAIATAAGPTFELTRLPAAWRKERDAAAAIVDYLEQQPDIVEVDGARSLARMERHIQLDDVSLVADDRRLLDNLTLNLPAGARVAVVADNRRSEQALAAVLTRLIDPTTGSVRVDEADLGEFTVASVRRSLIWVRRDGPLLPGTIRANIRCGDERSSSLQLTDAAKQARAHAFIESLPHGYDSEISLLRSTPTSSTSADARSGEPVVRYFVPAANRALTGGEVFRLSLARAALRSPAVLVVEEPSGDEVPAEEAELLDEALQVMAAERTLVILPGRLATLRSCDPIYLLRNGRLHMSGTHAQLIHNDALYRHINYVRFSPPLS